MRLRSRNFRLFALWAGISLLIPGVRAARAQGGPEGGPRGEGGRSGPMSPDERLKQMTKTFKLTDDQQAKIKPILVDEQKKMEDLRNNPPGDRQAMRAKMMKLRDDTNAAVRAQLDDKQKEKFDKLEQERTDRMQNRRGGGMGGPGGDAGGPPPPPQN